MNPTFWKSSVFAGLLILSACGRKEAVTADIESSVAANAAATDHVDWETSSKHPSKLFASWRFDRVTPEELCPVLMKRSPLELTLFENEINSKENADMVAPCRTQLRAKLDGYWKKQMELTGRAPLNFRFREIVEKRDFSKGAYIVHMDLAPKRVLLTFDDGPHPQNTDLILNTMKKVNAKAVFFHKGLNVRRYPITVKRVAAEGHGVGSHSVTHACLPNKARCKTNNERNGGHLLSDEEAMAEISGAHRAIQAVLGWVDPYFRFPYGESSPLLKQYLRDRQVGEFYWSNDSNDWRAQAPDMVVRAVMSQLQRGGQRGVILMHDIQRRTAEALPLLMKELYYNGYTPVILTPADKTARKKNRL